jgi:hypothetical protein
LKGGVGDGRTIMNDKQKEREGETPIQQPLARNLVFPSEATNAFLANDVVVRFEMKNEKEEKKRTQKIHCNTNPTSTTNNRIIII